MWRFCYCFVPRTSAIDGAESAGHVARSGPEIPSGARIAGAKVTVESADLSTEREMETSERGEFRVDALLPGEYWVRIEAADFQSAETRVDVQVSSGRDIDVVLKPVGVHQEVNVSGEASSITTQPWM